MTVNMAQEGGLMKNQLCFSINYLSRGKKKTSLAVHYGCDFWIQVAPRKDIMILAMPKKETSKILLLKRTCTNNKHMDAVNIEVSI